MQVIREQFNANEEILWEWTSPPENLLVQHRQDNLPTICLVVVGKQSGRERRFIYETNIYVPTQARNEIIRILRQIMPRVALTSYHSSG